MCYVEETKRYLIDFPSLSRIPSLKEYGFTKSFFCKDVQESEEKAKIIYKGLLEFEKGWSGVKTNRFSEKMRKYYNLVLKKDYDFFKT